MKNFEFKLMIGISAAMALVCFFICLFFNVACAFICLAVWALIVLVFAVFTQKRYRDIEELNNYLSEVCSGNYELAVADNAEGELSILKNNLYKVMILLRTASEEAKKDVHEANVAYLHACRRAGLFAAEKLGWRVIPCAKDGAPLPVAEISEAIYAAVSEVIDIG